jgi:hypothetical protein
MNQQRACLQQRLTRQRCHITLHVKLAVSQTSKGSRPSRLHKRRNCQNSARPASESVEAKRGQGNEMFGCTHALHNPYMTKHKCLSSRSNSAPGATKMQLTGTDVERAPALCALVARGSTCSHKCHMAAGGAVCHGLVKIHGHGGPWLHNLSPQNRAPVASRVAWLRCEQRARKHKRTGSALTPASWR